MRTWLDGSPPRQPSSEPWRRSQPGHQDDDHDDHDDDYDSDHGHLKDGNVAGDQMTMMNNSYISVEDDDDNNE